ncbi:MAG: hypothetical protein J7L15_00510 [Clostridiales bacterium]|nr:hypothetical protein [Clostridiales bacterium]
MQLFLILLSFVLFWGNACDDTKESIQKNNLLNNGNNFNNTSNSNNTNNVNNSNNILPSTEIICDDQIDNDGDGLQDCLDWDCANFSNCINFDAERICDDHISNDLDSYGDCMDHDCLGARYCTAFPKFTDFLIMFPGDNSVGGCKNPIALGSQWKAACVGPVVMGNFHLIDNENHWAVAYYDQESCNAASIADYGVRYEMFQLAFVNAPGGDYISPDIVCYAHCGPSWEGNHANVQISCFFRSDAYLLFNAFDENVETRDQALELDMTKVIFRQLRKKL